MKAILLLSISLLLVVSSSHAEVETTGDRADNKIQNKLLKSRLSALKMRNDRERLAIAAQEHTKELEATIVENSLFHEELSFHYEESAGGDKFYDYKSFAVSENYICEFKSRKTLEQSFFVVKVECEHFESASARIRMEIKVKE